MEACMVSSLGLTVTLDLITDNIMHGPVSLTRQLANAPHHVFLYLALLEFSLKYY